MSLRKQQAVFSKLRFNCDDSILNSMEFRSANVALKERKLFFLN